MFVASFENSADERLAYLSHRAYSSQWEIPEDVNKKVVDELKRQFGGKVFPQELRLLVWDINEQKTKWAGFLPDGMLWYYRAILIDEITGMVYTTNHGPNADNERHFIKYDPFKNR